MMVVRAIRVLAASAVLLKRQASNIDLTGTVRLTKLPAQTMR
jgi:hypothetical protein